LTGLWQPYIVIDWDLSVYNDYTDIEELIPHKIPISWRVALRLRRTFMTSYYVLLYVWENGIMCPIRLPEPIVRNTQPRNTQSSLYPSLEMWPEATAPIRPLPAIATVYQRTVNRHVIQRFRLNKPSLSTYDHSWVLCIPIIIHHTMQEA